MNITPHSSRHLMVIAELGGGNFAKLNSVPGFSRWEDRALVVRITGANIQYLYNNWPKAQWIGGSEKHLNEHLSRVGAAEAVSEAKKTHVLPDEGGYKYKRPPMDHQREAFLLSRDKKAFGWFMEQGTGKTKVTLDNAQWLYQQNKIEALVIVAWPNGVHRNWIDTELPEDMHLPYNSIYWTSNWSAKYRREALREMVEDTPPGTMRVLTFNVEAFASDHAKKVLIDFLKKFRCMLVIDQSASIKNYLAKRTKFLVKKAAPLAPYRRVLDGQPVAEGGYELYSQFQFLDPFIIGHDTWTGFRNEFCTTGYFNEIAEYQNLDELHRRIDGHCYRALADDCLDLPPRIYKRWRFDLSPDEGRIYNEMAKKSIAHFSKDLSDISEDDELTPLDDRVGESIEEALALTKLLRLTQIGSGWWPCGDVRPIDKKPTRMIALNNLLADIEGKVLIFSRFRADLELLEDELGDSAVPYHGGISEEARAEAKQRFQNDPKIKYFIGQPRTAGIGHTLTAASNVIFYTNDPSLRFREECEKRAHRKGQEADRLFIWDLIASGTTDLRVMTSLKNKKTLASEILKDPEGFFLEEGDQ